MSTRLRWNDRLVRQIADRLVPALDEINERIETGAKEELYPGHGKITGTLQRSIHTEPARQVGNRITGSIGTEKLSYALEVHHRYSYLTRGLGKVRPQMLDIIRRHVERNGD